MLRSMFAGVSGLRAHQTMMDVIANNISNVNTVGFKSSQVVFEDLLSQVLQNAGLGQGGAGGTNPAQVGLGVRSAAITTSFTQGASQLTGRSTDLSIRGDGFFMVQAPGGEIRYTRLGNFSFDGNGNLVSPEGSIVQGWLAAGGVVNTNGPTVGLSMPIGQTLPPVQTSTVQLGGNLNAGMAVGESVSTSITVYDSQGAAVSIQFSFTKASANSWEVRASVDGQHLPGWGDDDPSTFQSLTFDPSTGQPTGPLPALDTSDFPVGTWAAGSGIALDLGAPGSGDALVQFAGTGSSLAALGQDGIPLGFLQSFSISGDGLITGLFSNGASQVLGQIALATFANPAGLEKAGDSTYRATVNSGLPQIGPAGTGGRGLLESGTLEMSNVDLAQEFTNLVIAQRGFQANSRVITTSDQLLEDLVNLKR